MRQPLIRLGANELTYEIRGIVKKAEQIENLGYTILWENIGDPVQKNCKLPDWMTDIIAGLAKNNAAYSYCHSKGIPATRQFLADRNNNLKGAQITADDILFFNGLGDAIAKVYQFLEPTARIIGPSPAYSTHSSAEGAHANTKPITYKLDPENFWYPDVEDLYLKVKYNPNIVGILIINPDNPTGMVYPREILESIVAIADEFKLFLISDEIYINVTYNGAEAFPLAQVIGDKVPGIGLKGISKELPWPGSRCGWSEFYNRKIDPEFDKLCTALENAKMIEVCSTKFPQMAIPLIMGDARYQPYRNNLNEHIGKRSKIIAEILKPVPQITFNETYGAFYNTIVFKPGTLSKDQYLQVEDERIELILSQWLNEPMALDKQFVLNLLAAKKVCVVPISSFCSELQGFRVTLLEENEEILVDTFTRIRDGLIEYFESDKSVAQTKTDLKKAIS